MFCFGYGHEVWLGEASGANWLVEDLTRLPARRSGYGSIWPKTESWVRSPQELFRLKRGLGLPSSPPQASSRRHLYRQQPQPTSAAVWGPRGTPESFRGSTPGGGEIPSFR